MIHSSHAESAIGCLIGAAIVVAVIAALNLIIMLLWNWLMPHFFGLPELSFWQTLGFSALITLVARLFWRPIKKN